VETGPQLVEHLADVRVLAEIREELERRQHVFILVGTSRFVARVVCKKRGSMREWDLHNIALITCGTTSLQALSCGAGPYLRI
jgi:hypothetical protein